jgi:hypothetical protein
MVIQRHLAAREHHDHHATSTNNGVWRVGLCGGAVAMSFRPSSVDEPRRERASTRLKRCGAEEEDDGRSRLDIRGEEMASQHQNDSILSNLLPEDKGALQRYLFLNQSADHSFKSIRPETMPPTESPFPVSLLESSPLLNLGLSAA